ncbi:MAG TPA: hypothetical protein VNR40_12795 [Steroidobacter sp.]|nr:hypothetical protein [Steroidobacter sp.]
MSVDDGIGLLQIAKNNYRMLGLRETGIGILLYLMRDVFPARDGFDKRYGVETDGVVTPDAAGITDDRLRSAAILYAPIRENALNTVLGDTLAKRDPSQLTFVDLGSGKGRGLLIASRYPFARIIGVELSNSLAQIARENVRRYLAQAKPVAPIRCRQLDIQCTSATTFDYPDSDLLVYMYRPFTGDVFIAALDNLERFQRTTGRQVMIMLCCPNEEPLLAQHAAFRKSGSFHVIDREYSWVMYEGVATRDTATPPQDDAVDLNHAPADSLAEDRGSS